MVWLALVTGLLGSLHCVGMCGPIALALPVGSNPWSTFVGRLMYTMGRMLSYAVLGYVVGVLGWGMAWMGWQQKLSIFSGLLVIASVLFYTKLGQWQGLKGPYQYIRLLFQTFIQKKGLVSLFVLGVLNGLLPCGFVFIALSMALAYGNGVESAGFMALFGLGTSPLLILITYAKGWVTVSFRHTITRWYPVLLVSMGLMLCLRGLNLGIPYLSPKLYQDAHCTKMKCCSTGTYAPSSVKEVEKVKGY